MPQRLQSSKRRHADVSDVPTPAAVKRGRGAGAAPAAAAVAARPAPAAAAAEAGDAIFFNSKSREHYLLSNFYGGVEGEYQLRVALRGSAVTDLFAEFARCSRRRFVGFLKKLQPGKTWTPRKLEYWIRDGEPIRGILSKLAAGAVRNPQRWAVLSRLAPGVEPRPRPTAGDGGGGGGGAEEDAVAGVMLECLRRKFAREPFRGALLATGDRALHEKPMRGKGAHSRWTLYRDAAGREFGGDLLGRLLGRVRAELRAGGKGKQ